ncbi:porin [Paraburkholderia susongensis]|uniref:Outer membrane protein (Porin) n=1 Tax=Paraburkholderia susongensis TaxID=1515439 RepID=A0A1X7L8C8_9BURK|nr:porin [Paraburkholderia susongensis]SMG49744.1 Outer membrane protein (porin) [Paraburkholderia susongensis]
MKYLVACLPLAVCAYAHAQSSVTLYGAVDSALTYTNNQGGKSALQTYSGGRAGDKFGLRGVEDLGSNLKAVFVLEAGFSIETGAFQPANTLFGRQAYVGLSGDWGNLYLGRQYSMTNDYFVPLSTSMLFAGGLGATLGDIDGSWNYNKISNVIKYESPVYHGFNYSAMLSLGGTAGDFANNRVYGAGAQYANGGLVIAGAYMNMRTPATSIFGATSSPVAGAAFANPVSNPIFQNYVSATSQQVLGGGAKYTYGRSQASFLYSNVRFLDIVRTASNRNAPANAAFNNYQINYGFNFTPATMVGVAWQYSAAPHSNYNSFAAGTSYLFSKSTYVYGMCLWQHASGVDSTGETAVANLFGLTPSSTANQVAVRVGLRKMF